MKRLLIIAFVTITGFVYAQKSENRSVGSFKGVKALQGIDVYLKKGTKEAVRVEVSGVELKDVITEVSGEYLKIQMEHGNYRNEHSVKVYVTYVDLTKISASSAGNVFAENVIKAKELSLSASSAGTIDIQIEAEQVDVSASSAADIELKGKATSISINAVSAAEVDAYELVADNVDVQAVSAASAKVNVVKSIKARAVSGASIRYRGNPEQSNTTSTSGGSVKKSN
jgi:Putative auto-transporter adhesin, head GIN domain